MQNKYVYAAVALMLCAAPVVAQNLGNTAIGSGSQGQVCFSHSVQSVVGQNAGGEIRFCTTQGVVSSSTGDLTITASLTSPTLSGAGATRTISINNLSGCSVADSSTFSSPTTGAAGTQISTRWRLTMTATQCNGFLRATVNGGGPTTIFDSALPVNIMANDAVTRVDAYQRQCDDGVLGGPCVPLPNLILEAFNALLPMLLLAALVLWAEWTRSPLVYIAAALSGVTVVLGLWTEVAGMRVTFAVITFVILLRAYALFKDEPNGSEET